MRRMLMEAVTRAGLAYRANRYRRRVDPQELAWMRARLGVGDVAIDVGAYKGGYTYSMRRAVGSAGLVVAFEPQPSLAHYLRRCVHAFGWDNVHVVECAVSSELGRRPLWRPEDGPSPAASLVGASLPPGARHQEVAVDTLDHALASHGRARPVRFLKCDVEGHERAVFAGAHDVLVADRPSILVECEARHLRDHGIRDVLRDLEDLDYRGGFFWKGAVLPLDRFDERLHQVAGRRPYANNFAFEPVERLPR